MDRKDIEALLELFEQLAEINDGHAASPVNGERVVAGARGRAFAYRNVIAGFRDELAALGDVNGVSA